MQFTSFDYRFADEILRTKYPKLKKELEQIIKSIRLTKPNSGRIELNALFKKKFEAKGWKAEPRVFKGPKKPWLNWTSLKIESASKSPLVTLHL